VNAFTPQYFSTLEEFFTAGLKTLHPTGWVGEQARRKGWYISGKEGTEGTIYTYTLDINDMNSVGRATKKKDAKNFAFRNMAVRIAEKLQMIPKQPENLDEQLKAMNTASKPVVVDPNVEGCTPVAAVDAALIAHEIPKEIPKLSAEEIASLPGQPVTLLTEEFKRRNYNNAIFSCVNEDKVMAKGGSMYGKTMFTFKVKFTIGNICYAYFGQATKKKDAKNQSASFAYLGLMNKKIEEFSMKPPFDPILQREDGLPVVKLQHGIKLSSAVNEIKGTSSGASAVYQAATAGIKANAQKKTTASVKPAGAASEPVAAAAVPTIKFANKPGGNPVAGVAGNLGVTKQIPVASVPPQVKMEGTSPMKDESKSDRKRSRSRDKRSRSKSRDKKSRRSPSPKHRKRSSSRDRYSREKRRSNEGYGRASTYRDRSSSRDRSRHRR